MRSVRRTRATVVAGLLFVSLGLAACATDVVAGPAQVVGANGKPISCPTHAPSASPVATGALLTVVSGGIKRTYDVWMPLDYTGTRPVPLVVELAGTGGNGYGFDGYTGLSTTAVKAGFAVAAPDPIESDGFTTHWVIPGDDAQDDVAFMHDMLHQIESTFCVDPSRVYATGLSSGGAFTTWIACASNEFAALAPFSGINLVRPCSGAPVPLLVFHGTGDPIVPFHGPQDLSTPPPGSSLAFMGDVEKDVAVWAGRNGCSGSPIDVALTSSVTQREYQNCKADTVLEIVADGGHTIPGRPAISSESVDLGETNESINAMAMVLNFFSNHSLTRTTAANDGLPLPSTSASASATSSPAGFNATSTGLFVPLTGEVVPSGGFPTATSSTSISPSASAALPTASSVAASTP
jgi:polyhydroxybutyrate depolymerase